MARTPGKRSRSAVVAGALRTDIVSGMFAPGEHLTEDRLSERYGVSRIPVREALRGLEVEGFVVCEPYRGAQVAHLSLTDVLDLLEVRQTLETVATRRAAVRRPWDGVQQMAKLLDEGRHASESGDLKALAHLNTELHMTLVEASGNHNLVVLYDQIWAKAQWVYSVGLDGRVADSWHEHEDIVAAVAAGDAELAGRLAERHVSHAAEHFRHRTVAGEPPMVSADSPDPDAHPGVSSSETMPEG